MIKGIGVDLVDVTRFLEKDETRLDKIAERILTGTEMISYHNLTRWQKPNYLAKHWAVKEAVAKANGTGFNHDLTYKMIELIHDDLGAPKVKLAEPFSNNNCLVSISHDGDMVVAYAIWTAKWYDGVS